jgi:hypothetical protein
LSTRETVQAYHRARFRGDVAAAAATLGGGFTFESPLLSAGAEDHLAGLPAFLGIVTGVDVVSELYGADEATLVYDVHTATPVGTQHTAEHFRLADGRIVAIRLLFDASPWRAMLPAAGAGTGIAGPAGGPEASTPD